MMIQRGASVNLRHSPAIPGVRASTEPVRRPPQESGPGHSISGCDRGSSTLIKVCYHGATLPVVTCALLQPTDWKVAAFKGFCRFQPAICPIRSLR